MISGFLKLTTCMFLITILCFSSSTALAQQPSAPRVQAPVIIQYDGDMAAILTEMPSIYDVTIGLEVDGQQPHSQVVFDLREPTLAEVMNAIVKSAPKYQWREGAGFVELFPAAGSNPLLDTKINSFRTSEVDEAGAINLLMNLPEIQASLRALNLYRRAFAAKSTEKKSEKVSVTLEGVTLRQALNEIAKQSGRRFWIFRNYSGGFFSISSSAW
jgi:hypothetical protein